MSASYEEIIDGETVLRVAPGKRHEQICASLHARVAASLANMTTTRLLVPRSIIQLSAGTLLRPDLTLVTTANHKPWLIAEIVSSEDHRPDTVTKKTIYEDSNVPRLWMIDPRYDNVEVYYGSPYGLALKKIMAGREILQEGLLPNLQIVIEELFAA
jgi:Uma2 family endonuclease